MFLHPDDRAMVVENYQMRARGEDVPSRYVFRFVIKDGNIKWVEVSVVVIDWEGRPATLNFLTDISERKKMEEALRESEVRYRLLVESANEAIVVAQEGMLRFVNPATVALTGFSEPELVSVPFIKRIHPDDQAMVADRYQKRARGEPVPNRYIFRLLTGEGTTRWVEMNAVIIDWEGRPATLNFLTDITERKHAELALRESEERIRLLLNSTAEGIYGLDINGNCTFCNDSCLRLLGYDRPEELLGKNMHWQIHSKRADGTFFPVEECQIFQAFKKGEGAHVDGEVLWRSDDTYFNAEYWSYPQFHDGEVIGAVVSFLDITERKRAEVALHEASRKLNLLSSITRHDINNQLISLEGNLNLLGKKQIDRSSEQHLRKAEAAAERISAMIEFTKAYEDIGVNVPTWKDVRTLIGASAKDVPLGAVKVINDVPAGTEVFADPLIAKVFHNLVHNAVRHGGDITAIHFSVEEHEGVRSIVCEDDGTGISADLKDQLFTKGFGKDHGLGLFLSREILAITYIAISEVGEPGKGARFVMTMPKGGLRTT
jgi:PAS domain S-box-containing protein